MSNKTKKQIADEIKQQSREAKNTDELLDAIEKAKQEIRNYEGATDE